MNNIYNIVIHGAIISNHVVRCVVTDFQLLRAWKRSSSLPDRHLTATDGAVLFGPVDCVE